jgi:hypothetical protein
MTKFSQSRALKFCGKGSSEGSIRTSTYGTTAPSERWPPSEDAFIFSVFCPSPPSSYS